MPVRKLLNSGFEFIFKAIAQILPSMSTLPRIPNARQPLKVSQCFRKGYNITAVVPLSRTFNTAHYPSCSFRCRKAFPRDHQMALFFLQIETVALLCTWNATISFEGKRSSYFLYISPVVSYCSHSFQWSWKSCMNKKEITASGGGEGNLIKFWRDPYTKIFPNRRTTNICVGAQDSPAIHAVLYNCIKKAEFLSEK